jgi:hypothetical protein
MEKTKKWLFKYFTPVEEDYNITTVESSSEFDGNLERLMPSSRTRIKFMNRFSEDEIRREIEKIGLAGHLRRMGFKKIIIDIVKDDSMVHYLKLYNKEIMPEKLLIDLRVSESRLSPDSKFFKKGKELGTLDMIVIEWLSAENPEGAFSNDRPQLPGQDKPGLGVLNYLLEMMYVVAKEVTKDGFLDIPDHLHGAIMYSRNFKFFNPSQEAVLRAIIRDFTKDYSMVDISWGMITETIYEKNSGKKLEYKPSEQIFPVSDRLREYYKSSMYQEQYKKVYKKVSYRMDYEKMQVLREGLLKSKSVVDL